jgi:signal peptidase I
VGQVNPGDEDRPEEAVEAGPAAGFFTPRRRLDSSASVPATDGVMAAGQIWDPQPAVGHPATGQAPGPQAPGGRPHGAQGTGAQANRQGRDGAQPAGAQANRQGPHGAQPSGAQANGQGADGAQPPGAQPPGKDVARPRGRHGRPRRRSFWREFPVLVVVALALALVIKTYALQAFFIPSGSMENTLDIGDRVLINKLAYDFGSIHRGDVVVFNGAGSWDPAGTGTSGNPISAFFSDLGGLIGVTHGQDDYVKRVIGLPGDHVACCNAKGQVTVNGVPLSESAYIYPGNAPSDQRFSIVVPPGRLWMMGDHRGDSADSRAHMGISPGNGTIPESAVLGKVFVRIWPPSRWGFIGTPATFDQPKLNSALGTAIDSGNLRADPAGGPQLPLLLGFAGAVPVTLLTRRLRLRRRPE